jgi:hypothetical protein
MSAIPITDINTILLDNLSTLQTVDLSGNFSDLGSYANLINFNTVSSISAIYLSGETVLYIPDIPEIQRLSTLRSIESHYDTSTPESMSTSLGIMESYLSPSEKISTLDGISTAKGLSTIHYVEYYYEKSTIEAIPIEQPSTVTEEPLKVPIIRIGEIEHFSQQTLETETIDKNTLESLNYSLLKMNLYPWAASGFPDSYPAYKFPVIAKDEINGIIRCSDGNLRNIWEYISFILNSSIQEFIQLYEKNLGGIRLSYSIQKNPYIFVIHVTRQ